MIVCICNALNCRRFKDAAASGARDVPSAFKACEAKPRCGRCFETAEQVIKDAQEALIPQASPAQV
jgi:bacterioferritin-associated ferredoxin